MSAPRTLTPEAMFDEFINGRLSKGEWTHEAHLITCWVTLRDRSPSEALSFLRDSIKAHNCGIGTINSETSGYHETISVYYVGAIHEAAAATLDELLALPSCDRTAPLAYWNSDTLWSVAARLDFVVPDLAPLPWSTDLVTG